MVSKIGDLTALTQRVVDMFEEEFGSTPALAIAFTLAEDRKLVHWCTNVSRDDGIELLRNTAAKMIAQTN
jgi:hypothetical protein